MRDLVTRNARLATFRLRLNGYCKPLWLAVAVLSLVAAAPSRLSASPNHPHHAGGNSATIQDDSYTFPATQVGQTASLCWSVCYCSDVLNCTCDSSGTVELDKGLAPPFSAYGYMLESSGPNDCTGGTPVQLPVVVSPGQQVAFTVSFSPTSSGTFNDYLDLSGYDLSVSGSTPQGSVTPGQAGVLYGVSDTANNGVFLYSITNFSTNPQVNLIGATGLSFPAIAISPTSGIIYAVDPTTGYLYQLDAQSGASSFIGDTGLQDAGLVALACDGQGRLFSWGQDDGELYQLDPSSGAASPIGETGYAAGGDLAFDLNGTLYGSTGTDLIEIDPGSGASTYIGSFGTSNIFGLAIAGDGTLYAGQATSSSTGQLYKVTKDNAQLTSVGGALNQSVADLALFGGSAPQTPKLVPYQPSGWSGPLVVSTTPGTQQESATITSSDKLYASWAVANNGTAPTSVTFYTSLYLDGVLLETWFAAAPLNPNYYTGFKDFAFGPIAAGAHTLTLVPDSTQTVGPSDTTSLTLNVTPGSCNQAGNAGQSASCGPPLRLVATSLNIMSTNPAPERIQRISLQSTSTPLTFAIGEGFTLKVFALNANGTETGLIAATYSPSNQVVAQAPASSALSSTPIVLFPGQVILSFSGAPKDFFPVHSGTATLSVATSSGKFAVPMQITSTGYQLGTKNHIDYQGNDVDDPILGFADLHGIPPQVVKAVADQESQHVFNERAYRYEPLGFDFIYFSAGKDLRTNAQYSAYTVATTPDSIDETALPAGGGLDAGDLALREKFDVTVDSHNEPLPALTTVPAKGSPYRLIEASDGPIPMENILFTDNFSHGTYNWFTKTNGAQAGYVAFRNKGSKPFTAQTVLAASYGLMQAAPVTVIGYGFTVGGALEQPTDLFDKLTSLDAGTNVLAGKSQIVPVTGPFALPSAMRKQWAEALSFYNGANRNSVLQTGPTTYGLTVMGISDNYFPLQ